MQTVESRITAVTVFPDRARVTRTARVTLAAGEQVVQLAALPLALDSDSVRVTGRGTGVRLVGVDVADEYHSTPPETPLAELKQNLERLLQTEKALLDDDAALAARLEFAQKLRAASTAELAKGLAFGRTTIESVQAVTQYLAGEEQDARAQRRDLEVRRAHLAREIANAQARLRQVEQPEPQQRKAIRVTLDAADATEAWLEATYQIADAWWIPLYDLRLTGQQLALSYLASITQRTGEDWPAAELTLSTARPAVSTAVPELEPWFLDVYTPPVPRVSIPQVALRSVSPADTASFAAPAPAMAAPEMDRLQEELATVESSGTAVSYKIPRALAIPADGSPHRALIANFELPAQLDHITAPKIAAEAYLRAKIVNQSPYTLLSGEANLFHEQEFVGATDIPLTAPHQTLELQLGIDDRVTIARELVSRDASKAFLGNTRKLEYAYRIKLQNLTDRPARISVLDQLPHSRTEEIKVKLTDTNPKPAEQTDLGVLTWKLELAPQAKQEIQFAYSVEHARQLRITGLAD
jgi:uncharacterized protein (TIGR02231 family)